MHLEKTYSGQGYFHKMEEEASPQSTLDTPVQSVEMCKGIELEGDRLIPSDKENIPRVAVGYSGKVLFQIRKRESAHTLGSQGDIEGLLLPRFLRELLTPFDLRSVQR